MDYYSKTIILHQIESTYSIKDKTLSGICRIEVQDGVANCFLTLINIELSSDNFFFCLIDNDNTLFIFPLNSTSTTISLNPSINFENGFSIGLFSLENGIPFLFAYSKYNNGIELSLLKKKLYDNYMDIPKIDIDNISEKLKAYNDEAVATENYFDNDEDAKQKLDFIKSFEDISFEKENEEFDIPKFEDLEKEEQKEKSDEELFIDSLDLDDEKEKKEFSKENPFFLTVKTEIDDIFNKFPLDTTLKSIIPNSKFAKINYSESKYYVVGLIFENGKEKYICYGVPDKYSKNPPKELKGYCQFVPLSLLNLSGDGYWMMFQSAIDGSCVKLK